MDLKVRNHINTLSISVLCAEALYMFEGDTYKGSQHLGYGSVAPFQLYSACLACTDTLSQTFIHREHRPPIKGAHVMYTDPPPNRSA